MMKIVIVSPNFREKRFWKRWELFAQQYKDVEVVLLAPSNWTFGALKNYTFGKKIEFEGQAYEDANFKVRLIHTKQNMLNDWTSPDMGQIIKDETPDFLYVIGSHVQYSMMQALRACKKFCPNAKRLTFTMRSDNPVAKVIDGNWKAKLVNLVQRRINNYNVKHSDAIFCHYPDARHAILKEGYKGHVYMNTQIGVDKGLFSFSQEGRDRIRGVFHVGDSFLFGSATRFNPQKGILDILEALPPEKDWRYMILGSGREDETAMIKRKVQELGYEDRVIMPGLIGWDKLSDYLSALDCALHVPRTEGWKETFSLALVQAIAVGRPTIGNTSGSVPYQCGPDGIIVEEGKLDKLREKMVWMIDNPDEAQKIGLKQKQYVMDSFETARLNECLYGVLQDIKIGVQNPDMIDTVPSKYRK